MDSSLEGNGFEISVPRCLATANSVGAVISAVSGGSLSRNSSIGLPRPTLGEISHRGAGHQPCLASLGLRSIGPGPTEASKPLPIWRGTEISNPFPSSTESSEMGLQARPNADRSVARSPDQWRAIAPVTNRHAAIWPASDRTPEAPVIRGHLAGAGRGRSRERDRGHPGSCRCADVSRLCQGDKHPDNPVISNLPGPASATR